jgi:hypothetical protein
MCFWRTIIVQAWGPLRYCIIGAVGLVLGFPSPENENRVFAAEEETPKEIIAIQIRRQGYPCENPQSATRDPKHTKPDEAAWVLACEDATYRVILIPDMAARVTRVK